MWETGTAWDANRQVARGCPRTVRAPALDITEDGKRRAHPSRCSGAESAGIEEETAKVPSLKIPGKGRGDGGRRWDSVRFASARRLRPSPLMTDS